jgi:hypothetical protein
MVDLLQAYDRAPATAPANEPPDVRDWSRYAPWLLVAFAVGFGAWLLRPELHSVFYPNDATTHAAMSRFAEQRIRAHHNPFDAWFPYLNIGVPQFAQYQSVPSIITGLLSIPLGNSVFRWSNYLMICTWPVSVYLGARLLGLDRWQAAAASLFSPLLVNVSGYGFEWQSFVWLGSGMWSMLWALWLMPIAMGLAWRAVSKGERIPLAAFVVGLTCAFHFLTGYLVLLSLGVFMIVRPPEFLRRLGRGAVIGLGGVLIFAFVFVPPIVDLAYINLDSFTRGTFWVDSYGPGKVLSWLVRGEVFDYARRPIISLLVLVGAGVAIARSIRSEVARVALGLMILSLALYSGRRVVGPVIEHLPGGGDLLLHRYIIGVHFAGLLLAGIGAVWAFQVVVAGARAVLRVPAGEIIAVALVSALAAVVLLPVLNDRKQYADVNRFFIDGQVAVDRTAGADLTALIDLAKRRNDGRIYAGGSGNWGAEVKLYQVPLYQLPAQHDADSVGFYLRTSSLSTNIEPYFNDADPAQYDLFNIKYVVLPDGRQPSVPARAVTRRGIYTLYEVATSGYLEVVDTTEPVSADRTDMAAVFTPYISSPAVAQLRHPLVRFDGRDVPLPSSSSSQPYAGPPGAVDWANISLDDGRFTGQVQASRPAWVMLKESFHKRWTASVDGVPVKPQMLAPSFVGVPVSPGTHLVVFRYRSSSAYPALFAFGALVLVALVVVPVLWRRYRRRRAGVPRRRADQRETLA